MYDDILSFPGSRSLQKPVVRTRLISVYGRRLEWIIFRTLVLASAYIAVDDQSIADMTKHWMTLAWWRMHNWERGGGDIACSGTSHCTALRSPQRAKPALEYRPLHTNAETAFKMFSSLGNNTIEQARPV